MVYMKMLQVNYSSTLSGFFQESVLVLELVDIFFNDLADRKGKVLIIFANDMLANDI